MSIKELTTANNYKLFCSSIVNKNIIINLPGSFTATPPTPIPNFRVIGFYFPGTTIMGNISSVVLKYELVGGVLGTTTFYIKSMNSLTTYYSGIFAVDGSTSLNLSASTALPASPTALSVQIESDGTSNSSFALGYLILTFA